MKTAILSCVTFVLLLVSCSKEKQEKGNVLIRVQNETSQRATAVSIISFSVNNETDFVKDYGTIEPGASSGYQRLESIYAIPVCKLYLDGFGIIDQTAVCGTGLTQITNGKYVLAIGVDNNNYPSIKLVKE